MSAESFGEEVRSRKEDEAFSVLDSTAVFLREDAAEDTEIWNESLFVGVCLLGAYQITHAERQEVGGNEQHGNWQLAEQEAYKWNSGYV